MLFLSSLQCTCQLVFKHCWKVWVHICKDVWRWPAGGSVRAQKVCVWDLPQSLVSSSELHHPMARAGLSPPILLGVQNWRPVSFSMGKTLNYFLKWLLSIFSPFLWSIGVLIWILELQDLPSNWHYLFWFSFYFARWKSTFNDIFQFFYLFSLPIHFFYFPGEFLLLLLSEFLVTSYLCVRNVIFSPNSEYFVDFF